MSVFLNVSSHVRVLEFDHILVLLNTQTGHIEALDATGIRLWRGLAQTRSAQGTAHAVGLSQSNVDAVVGKLLDEGILQLRNSNDPWPVAVAGRLSEPGWGTGTVAMCLEQQKPGIVRSQVIAAAAVAITLLTRHAGRKKGSFGRLLRLARTAMALARRRATPAQTTEAVHTVRYIARLWPARIACLEESIAALLWLTVHNQGATWCHGVAPDPVRFHAWLAVDGEPIAEPDSTTAYTPLIELSATRCVSEVPTRG